MRFVLAIVSFLLAFLLIGYGVAQRTFLAGPDHVTAKVTTDSNATLTIIDSKVLRANPGRESLTVSGANRYFVAYGRTADVMAWVGDASYNRIGYDVEKKTLTSKSIAGKETQVPDPRGSDLWLDERSSDFPIEYAMNIPSGISVIVASDGEHPAPSEVSVRWPLDTRTPWSGPLIIAGALMLLLGLGLYFWALFHLRRARGPRRKSPKMPKVPRQRRYKPRASPPPAAKRGRRRTTRTRRMIAVVPVLLVGSLAVSSCSADAWPTFLAGSSTTPTPTATADADVMTNRQHPAVSLPQLDEIITDIADVAAEADKSMDAKLLETRFEGPALATRKANYALRKKDSSVAAVKAFPSGVVKLALPQQNDAWPRTVFTVLLDPADETVSPTAVMLEQLTPRENYKVVYAMGLEAKVVLPKVAPANIGAGRLQDDFPLLRLQPSDLAGAFGDILLKGEDSEFFTLFDTTGSSFLTLQGFEAKKKFRADLPDKVKVEFSNKPGSGEIIAFSTNNLGAIVAVNLIQTQTVSPTEAGASLNTSGQVKTLSGIKTTLKGIVSTYGDQLLFYVPKKGSNEKIKLLGDADSLISAKEKK